MSNDVEKFKNNITEYLKQIIPVSIVSFITFFIYSIGFAYLAGYFSRLQIDVTTLNLPLTFFLQKSIVPISYFLFTVYIGYYLGFVAEKKNLEKAKFNRTLFLIIATISAFYVFIKLLVKLSTSVLEIKVLIYSLIFIFSTSLFFTLIKKT